MIQFTKMQGLGNDYVYIDCTKDFKIENISLLAKKISDRHFGIGSDGLVLICSSKIADFKMRMFNSDGSESEMCGNAIRCVGKYVYDKGLISNTSIKIETLAGIKLLELQIENGTVKMVSVDMGEPIFEPEKIPVIIEDNIGDIAFPKMKLSAAEKTFEFSFVSVGNPHAITIVDDIKKFEVERYGKLLEIDRHFPNRSNIEFVELVDKNNVKMRVWERGAGETLACGTGATAVFIACVKNGMLERRASVELLGGILEFSWSEETNHVYMTGPAAIVFEGEFNENEI